MIPGVVTAKVAAVVGVCAWLAGLAIGGYVAHAFYAPRLEAANTKIDALGGQIQRQNDAIDDLVKAGKARAESAKKAIDAAKSARDQVEADLQLLLTLQPPAGVNRCDAASALVKKELGK